MIAVTAHATLLRRVGKLASGFLIATGANGVNFGTIRSHGSHARIVIKHDAPILEASALVRRKL
jgi:hypothetical protein